MIGPSHVKSLEPKVKCEVILVRIHSLALIPLASVPNLSQLTIVKYVHFLSDYPFVLKHLRGVLSSSLINSCLLHIISTIHFNSDMCVNVLVISKAFLLRSCLTL